MDLEKKPFELHQERTEDLKAIKYPLHLNVNDIKDLETIGKLMQEEKMGTVIKNLIRIGITCLLNDPVLRLGWETAFKKKQQNERIGIMSAKVDFSQKYNKDW